MLYDEGQLFAANARNHPGRLVEMAESKFEKYVVRKPAQISLKTCRTCTGSICCTTTAWVRADLYGKEDLRRALIGSSGSIRHRIWNPQNNGSATIPFTGQAFSKMTGGWDGRSTPPTGRQARQCGMVSRGSCEASARCRPTRRALIRRFH